MSDFGRNKDLRKLVKPRVQDCQMTEITTHFTGIDNEVDERISRSEEHRGVAPIKANFLIPKEEIINIAAQLGGTHILEDINAIKSRNKENRKLRKGMNRNRMKEMKQAETQIRASSSRLCPSVIQNIKCRFGEKCTSEHDIQVFLSNKPDDIGIECPIFNVRGTCPYTYACRFGKAHLNTEGKQISKEPEIPYKETMNASSMHIQIALRKRTYIFKEPGQATADVENFTLGSVEREKPKLDMNKLSGKKYLAPLTTVGNLPFRRICVDLGADVTCGEMALATSLLSGCSSEYSLLKRHSTEKIFGVQLAGGFEDTMSKAAQIITNEMDIDFIDINMGCPIDIVNRKGGGCALPNRPNKMMEVMSGVRSVMKGIPLTVKIRSGMKEGSLTAADTIRTMISKCPPDLITFHPRSKEQRYTKLANWKYVKPCADAAGGIPLWVCGDILSWQDYYTRLEENPIGGIMIGRGALIKPWLFTEIDERRTWDIAATERLDLLKTYVNYGLDHWGSDDAGVERTRRFLLEWLSFQCRYIPVGLLETLPQCINDRPPQYRGRSDLETLLSSQRAVDWIEISKMLLGPTPEGFTFIPKHKASSY